MYKVLLRNKFSVTPQPSEIWLVYNNNSLADTVHRVEIKSHHQNVSTVCSPMTFPIVHTKELQFSFQRYYLANWQF